MKFLHFRFHSLAALCLAFAACGGAPGTPAPAAGPAAAGATPSASPPEQAAAEHPFDATISKPEDGKMWSEYQRLVDEQRFQAALEEAEAIEAKARQQGDEWTWSLALVRRAQAKTALSGYETAAAMLRQAEWPRNAFLRSAVQLFYGQGLVSYYQAYSWQIAQRERQGERAELSLDAWTRKQIQEEALGAYREVWSYRDELGELPVERYQDFLEPNDYPEGVRPTLRDAVTYLFVDLLADTSLWSPRQLNETYLLDLGALLDGSGEPTADGHPLEEIAAVLRDLESFHAERGETAAALEAALERYRRLRASFSAAEDHRRIRQHLSERLAAARDIPWWSTGMAEVAGLFQAEDEPDSLIRAHAAASEGATAYPGSIGAQRCAAVVAQLEAPRLQVAAMASDGLGKRSVEIRHRGLDEVFFRAYRLPLQERLRQARPGQVIPQGRQLMALVSGREPAAEWRVELPATRDFRDHRTYSTPPLEQPGLYALIASASQRFQPSGNQMMALSMTVGDLVLVSRSDPDGGLQVRLLSGASGRPRAGGRVELWEMGRGGARRIAQQTAGRQGEARLSLPAPGQRSQVFVLARDGEEIALEHTVLRPRRPRAQKDQIQSLLYTDRSIYRPGQRLSFKTLLYRGDARSGELRLAAGESVTVSLHDPNGEEVASQRLQANDFGTAGGEMTLPAGRPLGQWVLRTSRFGRPMTLRVEEYRRPTFEVSLDDPAEAPRLNQTATLSGTASYFFGQPVSGGKVVWRITREPRWPPWWGYFRGPIFPSGESQTVAAGTSTVDAAGQFALRFEPKADPRLAEEEAISYRYRVEAELTDEAGETQETSRVFSIGLSDIEASVEAERSFFLADRPIRLMVRRAGLNGEARPGTGTWRLVRLEQPEEAVLPADQPVVELEEGAEEYRTPGDRLRPRWESGGAWRSVVGRWPAGETVAEGRAEHGDSGRATLEIPPQASGAYRLLYETEDARGVTVSTPYDLLVAAPRPRLELPAVLLAEESTVGVGGALRLLVHSGLDDQSLLLQVWREGALRSERLLRAGAEDSLVEIPVTAADQGGFTVRLVGIRDHQALQQDLRIHVPWQRRLELELTTFRNRLRPGQAETWTVAVRGTDGRPAEAGAVELLAAMYDRSLDELAPFEPFDPYQLFPDLASAGQTRITLGQAYAQWLAHWPAPSTGQVRPLNPDRLRRLDSYGVGGLGSPGGPVVFKSRALGRSVAMESMAADAVEADGPQAAQPAPQAEPAAEGGEEEPPALRSDFAETAFFQPHLITDADGKAAIEFQVPESVTAWRLWILGVARDLSSGLLEERVETTKELVARPYLPRFLRQGDRATLEVAVDNTGETALSGKVEIRITDPGDERDVSADFGLAEDERGRTFEVAPGQGTTVSFELAAPRRLGEVDVQVVARGRGDGLSVSDGELRPLPLLPARFHLAQSRFAAIEGGETENLVFDDLRRDDDPSRRQEQLVVTVDAQLLESVLAAMPYLIDYPYETTEKQLNEFVICAMVSSLYQRYPRLRRLGEELARRESPYESWRDDDPNRQMRLEETPWLQTARGGDSPADGEVLPILDPEVAAARQRSALRRLREAQSPSGGFPWWSDGRPSPFVTLYILRGLARAVEFGAEVPPDLVVPAWSYLLRELDDDSLPLTTFLVYAATTFPDESWIGDAFGEEKRRELLQRSFERRRELPPYSKAMLALSLGRMGRSEDARRVLETILDSAKVDPLLGTYWAPEDRAWIWYNDTVEGHAFALQTVLELAPEDQRLPGLVQWLFLNKKLSHWKSTRATAEALDALVRYLEAAGSLGAPEAIRVVAGDRTLEMQFDPERYSGKGNQLRVPGEKIDPTIHHEVEVENRGRGLAFATATWHFSTESLPEAGDSDLFAVERRYFRRDRDREVVRLTPLADGVRLEPGDEVEVQLVLRARHAAEYVHLRDPRPAGLEPAQPTSGWRWDGGLGRYEEVRDSGTNFFFDWMPAGEYTLRYRLRAAVAGRFQAAPATLQSLYAPEFTAYSAGSELRISSEED